MLDKDIVITLVEQQDSLREGLALMINGTYGYQVLNTYKTYMELLHHLKEDRPHVILASNNCLDNQNITCKNTTCDYIRYISEIKKISPASKIIVFTHHENEDLIFNMLKAGADGYLTKNSSPVKLLESIKEVFEGGAPLSPSVAKAIVSSFHKNTSSPLTPREVQVLELLYKGKTHSMIAHELFIDKETVRTHIKNIYSKMEVHSKAEAIEKAIHEKFI
jgi:DNA-binding NarL/FixJ family response regulator